MTAVTATPTTTTSPPPTTPMTPPKAPGDCDVDNLDPHKQFSYNLTFLNLKDHIVTSPHLALTSYGDPQLDLSQGMSKLRLLHEEDALELQCVPCVSNLLQCDTGFTIRVDVTFSNDAFVPLVNSRRKRFEPQLMVEKYQDEEEERWTRMESRVRRESPLKTTDRIFIVDSIEDQRHDMGIQIFYEHGDFNAVVQLEKKKWTISEPHSVEEGVTYRIELSWHPSSGLDLYVNGYSVGHGRQLSLPFLFYSGNKPLLLGRGRTSGPAARLTLSQLFVWMAPRDELVSSGLVKGISHVFRTLL